jgi:metal-responsive CopG/Arc/MetJ family transcriptional regulator
MKIAISVPDQVSRAADRTAKRLRVPRSQFYTRAVQAYLKQTSADDVTAQLDAVYSSSAPEPDAFLLAAAKGTFRRQR